MVAEKTGKAAAILRMNEETLQMLENAEAELHKHGITLVSPSVWMNLK